MFSHDNKVSNDINKLILKSIIKNPAILEYSLKTNTELTLNNLISSQNVHNLKGLTGPLPLTCSITTMLGTPLTIDA